MRMKRTLKAGRKAMATMTMPMTMPRTTTTRVAMTMTVWMRTMRAITMPIEKWRPKPVDRQEAGERLAELVRNSVWAVAEALGGAASREWAGAPPLTAPPHHHYHH